MLEERAKKIWETKDDPKKWKNSLKHLNRVDVCDLIYWGIEFEVDELCALDIIATVAEGYIND